MFDTYLHFDTKSDPSQIFLDSQIIKILFPKIGLKTVTKFFNRKVKSYNKVTNGLSLENFSSRSVLTDSLLNISDYYIAGRKFQGVSPTANRANGQLAYLWRPYLRYMNWFPSKVRDASTLKCGNIHTQIQVEANTDKVSLPCTQTWRLLTHTSQYARPRESERSPLM